MTDAQVEIAALNNALWCDVVCDARGIPGELLEDVWLNRHPTPRYYPNLVTLTPAVRAAPQMAQIQALLRSDLPGGWAVKDSFSTLDLAPLGFQVAFSASWLWLAPQQEDAALFIEDPALEAVRWAAVQSPDALQRWEMAWAGNLESALAPADRIFMPDLLDQAGVVFIAGYRAEAIVAGVIANRTEDVVGISNLFGPVEKARLYWRGCTRAVASIFPGLPLVGYEHGDDLAHALALGFEEIGRLRVWTCLESA